MDLRHLSVILWKRRGLITAAILLCTAASIGASLASTPVYQASAKLLVVAKSDQSGGVNSAYEGALLSQQLVKSFAQVLESRRTADAALRLQQLPLTPSQVQAKVHAQPLVDTLLIDLSVDDTDPARAQILANNVARGFIQEVVPTLESGSALKVSLVEPALRPRAPVSPRTTMNTTIGILLGILVGIGFALLAEQLDTSIRNPEALEAAIGIPILGAIPIFDATKQTLPVSRRPRSSEAEAFRKLRTNFAFMSVDRDGICCVVTSPMASEGKSTITTNLALALAHAGQRVIIVEADLRKPSLHKIFGLEQRVGTTTVLLGQANASEALQTWGGESVAVLTSGQLPPNPSELLGSHQMAELVIQLRKQSDVVLLDCPPLLPVTDPMVASQFADGVLLIARSNSTTRDQIQAARATCERVGARLFGAVLNAATVAEGDQPLYYGYYGERTNGAHARMDNGKSRIRTR